MNTLEAFHMRCQRQIFDVWWWVHDANAEVLQRFGLSTIGDILRHRRLSVFGHVARMDLGVPAHDALRLMVDTHEGRKNSWRRQRLAQQGSGGCQRSYYLCCGDLISPAVTERSDGHSDYATTMMVMMMMKDVYIVSRMEGKTNFSMDLPAVRNRDCWMFENHRRMCVIWNSLMKRPTENASFIFGRKRKCRRK